MLKHKLLLPEGILIIEPDKPLAVADFEAITQEIDPYIAKHGMLPGLLIHAKAFPGWANFAAFYAHMGLVKSHHQKLQRLALVTDSRFLAELPKFAGPLVHTELKHFPQSQYDEALRWLERQPR